MCRLMFPSPTRAVRTGKLLRRTSWSGPAVNPGGRQESALQARPDSPGLAPERLPGTSLNRIIVVRAATA